MPSNRKEANGQKSVGGGADEQRSTEENFFSSPPADAELSLSELSQAFAQAIGSPIANAPLAVPHADQAGEDPTEPEDVIGGESDGDETVEDETSVSPKAILEAILFVGHPENEPITSQVVSGVLRGVEPAEIDELVVELNDSYEHMELPIRIQSVGNGYRMELEGEFDHVRQRFYGRVRHAKLTRPAVDVLAIVAYHQPVTRKRVDELMGISSGKLLAQLVRRELLALHPGEKAREKIYMTTERFLALFNLEDISDLPRTDDPQ